MTIKINDEEQSEYAVSKYEESSAESDNDETEMGCA